MYINHTIFSGNLTRDPELKELSNHNTSVVNFTVAGNRKHKAKGSTQARQETTFVDCEAWDTGATSIAKYFSKGDPIIVEGQLKQENWETDGQKRSRLKLRVEKFHFIPKHEYSAASEDEDAGFEVGNDDNPF